MCALNNKRVIARSRQAEVDEDPDAIGTIPISGVINTSLRGT
jgi:hypothetical protein